MANSEIDSEIRDRIESFLTEISQLVKASALEAVREVLGDGGPAPARTAVAARSTKKRGKQTAARKTSSKKGSSKKGSSKKRASKGTGRPGRPRNQSDAATAKLSEKVTSFVAANPGARVEEMAKAFNVSSADLKQPVTDLLEAKKLRKTGQKRGTKYYAK